MPSCLRQAQQIGDRDAGHPEDRIDPVQLQRLHHEVEAVRHVHGMSAGISAALISPTLLLVAQGLMRLGALPSTADPPARRRTDDNQELCANAALLNLQQISSENSPHRL